MPVKQRPLNICPGFTCTGSFGKCIPAKNRCNGFVDCLNGEDESGCESYINNNVYRESIIDSSNGITNSTEDISDSMEESTTQIATTDLGNYAP